MNGLSPRSKAGEIRGRHLTEDEIWDRVFPSSEEPAPVPMHLAVCPDCQGKVARLREGWLLDRGAVQGLVESHPEAFWRAQSQAVMTRVASEQAIAPFGAQPIPFSLQRSFLRRPVLAFGSLVAALALVAGISFLGSTGVSSSETVRLDPVPVPTVVVAEDDRKDDELLLEIDHVLAQESPLSELTEGLS